MRSIFYICIFVLMAKVSARADEGQQALHEAMTAVGRSANCFDNIQAEYREETNLQDSQSVVINRFWSREGRYFRIDTIELIEGKAEVMKRIVVRPEGFVKMDREPNKGRLVITDFGTEEQGLWSLYGFQFFRSTIRGNFAFLDQVFQDEKLKLDGVTRDGTELTVRLVGKSLEDNTAFEYDYVIDLKRGVCVQWRESILKDGRKVGGSSVVKDYAKDFADLCPTKLYAVSDNSSFLSTRTKYQMEPAPVGLFDLGIQGHTSSRVWYRRFLLFLILILGIGGWLVSKYRKER